MGRDPTEPRHRTAALTLCALAFLAGAAQADPLVTTPATSRKATWGGGPKDVAMLAFLAEVRAVGVLGADRLTSWPDRRLGIEPGLPQLIAARAGLLCDLLRAPWTFVLRVDLGEPTRPTLDGDPGAVAGALVDDLYARFRGSPALQVTAGRARVPFTRLRHLEEVAQPLGAPPFLVDRVAPDRRAGITLDGELGAFAYAAGVYEDLDVLEPRERRDDPSRAGAVATAAQVVWSPPSLGRPSLGAGTLWRAREDGSHRLDGALSAQLEWPFFLALVEGIVSVDTDTALGAHALVAARPITKLTLSVRGELDGGAADGGSWAAAAGIGWDVTRDRRNRVEVVGWLRRDRDRGTPFDGIVVYLQASL